jgi:peptidoglycan/xylan/chitin deacetylase (PgdA/CDA1 family)
MSLLDQAQVSSWLRGHLLCRIDGIDDRFAVTFDDGPNPRATGRIRDVLARHGAHATFFMLAGPVRRERNLVRELHAQGHELGGHGEHHIPPLFLPPAFLAREIRAPADAIESVTGTRPRHYRPPFGLMLPSQARFARRLGLVPVLGDVYPEDALNQGVERVVERVLGRLRGGSILILHDGSAWIDRDRSQTVEALDRILTVAAARGLAGVTVADLLRVVGARESAEAPFYT